jgi:hypothetical protein
LSFDFLPFAASGLDAAKMFENAFVESLNVSKLLQNAFPFCNQDSNRATFFRRDLMLPIVAGAAYSVLPGIDNLVAVYPLIKGEIVPVRIVLAPAPARTIAFRGGAVAIAFHYGHLYGWLSRTGLLLSRVIYITELPSAGKINDVEMTRHPSGATNVPISSETH